MTLKHQSRARRKMRCVIRQSTRSVLTPDIPLLFLTDPQRTPDILSIAARLPAGTGVVYRHFGASDRRDMAHALARVCRRKGLAFLIAADPKLALSVGAHGVHWPEAQLARAGRYRGAFAYQTASAHSRTAIWQADNAGIDAALVSAVFPSRSPSAGPAMGAIRFRNLARHSPLPLYALGGVNSLTGPRIAAYAGLAGIEGIANAFL